MTFNYGDQTFKILLEIDQFQNMERPVFFPFSEAKAKKDLKDTGFRQICHYLVNRYLSGLEIGRNYLENSIPNLFNTGNLFRVVIFLEGEKWVAGIQQTVQGAGPLLKTTEDFYDKILFEFYFHKPLTQVLLATIARSIFEP